MTREFRYSGRARRDLKRLDQFTRRRVVEAIRRYVAAGAGDVKRLKEPAGLWRLRVGDWRVLLAWDEDPALVTIVAVSHRSQAYR